MNDSLERTAVTPVLVILNRLTAQFPVEIAVFNPWVIKCEFFI